MSSGFPIVRDVTLSRGGGSGTGQIIIRSVEEDRDRECWVCRWRFPPLLPEEIATCGEDGLQALLICIREIMQHIAHCSERGIQVFWLSPEDKGGFDVLVSFPDA